MESKRTFEPLDETKDTKARVIAAATRLFAEKGMDKVVLRELTSAAGVNLAAVNYHFGSKEALCEAVLDSLSERVNAQRLGRLRQVLGAAERAGQRPALRAILETFIAPYLDTDAAGDGAILMQLFIQDRIHPSEMTARITRRHFDPLAQEYIAAFVQACPDVQPDDFYWRYVFTYSAVILTASDRSKARRIEAMSMGRIDGTDLAAQRAALLDYLAAAIAAPSRPPPAFG